MGTSVWLYGDVKPPVERTDQKLFNAGTGKSAFAAFGSVSDMVVVGARLVQKGAVEADNFSYWFKQSVSANVFIFPVDTNTSELKSIWEKASDGIGRLHIASHYSTREPEEFPLDKEITPGLVVGREPYAQARISSMELRIMAEPR